MINESSSVNAQLDAIPEARKQIIIALKKHGKACASTLSKELNLTREACRQQLQILQQQGLIDSHSESQGGAGRPKQLFCLSNSGEHLFPKHYDQLTVQIIDTVQEQLGTEQLKGVLSAISQKQVAQWRDKMVGLNLKEKLNALKNFYFANDPFTEVVEDDEGLWLIEKNCPFLNLASERPALCSVTVSTLMSLLGVKVVREKRFQAGDGHCAFHVFPDQPIAPDFVFELE